jgi:hypothetical protein
MSTTHSALFLLGGRMHMTTDDKDGVQGWKWTTVFTGKRYR